MTSAAVNGSPYSCVASKKCAVGVRNWSRPTVARGIRRAPVREPGQRYHRDQAGDGDEPLRATVGKDEG